MAWTSKDPVQYLVTLYSIMWSVCRSHADWSITKHVNRNRPYLYCVRKRKVQPSSPCCRARPRWLESPFGQVRPMTPGHAQREPWTLLTKPPSWLPSYYYLATFVPLLTHVPGNRRRSINTHRRQLDLSKTKKFTRKLVRYIEFQVVRKWFW